MRDPVAALLDPGSVAVIGASNNPLKRGYQAMRQLLDDGFPHPIYPVNPRETEVLGLRAYPSLEDIDGPVDLALIATPAEMAPRLLAACGAKGVLAAVVIAVGFGETGDEGRALEEEAARVARRSGVTLVGPNTNGVFNLPARLNVVGAGRVPQGPIGLVCQSGNMGLSLFAQTAHETALGFSVYVGIGNEAGLRYHELLPYLAQDQQTEAVLVYAEGFRDGRAFLRAARDLGRTKPVVVYKAGRSAVARCSALSHTGAIAGSPRVADALLRQAGTVVVERSDELVPVCETVLSQPPLAGPRVAVLADGGGHATVAADALSTFDLELPELGPRSTKRLRALLPPAASSRNPVDLAGAADRDPGVFEECLRVLLEEPRIDGILCVGLLGGYGLRFSDELAQAEEQTARNMAALATTHRKPLVVQSTYFHARPRAHALLRAGGVPVHASVETAARCLAALWERGRMLATMDARSTFAEACRTGDREGARVLTEPAGRELLASAGLPVRRGILTTDADEAASAVHRVGGPVALKVVSPDVVHKTDVGGVLLGVESAEEARRGFAAVVEAVRTVKPDSRIEGILVTPMAAPGLELLVGAATDPTFGPVLTVGAGGTAVEVREDVAFRAIPVTPLECREMLDDLRIAAVLDGVRGAGAVDREALIELLLGVSHLMEARRDIVELDLNPVIAHPAGLEPVDVRVVVTGEGSTASSAARR